MRTSPSLTNFERQKYYQNKPRFNGVYSRYKLLKIEAGTYFINLDEQESTGTHWIDMELKNFKRNKKFHY